MGPRRQCLPTWGLRVSEKEERRGGAGWPTAGPIARARAGRERGRTGSAQMRRTGEGELASACRWACAQIREQAGRERGWASRAKAEREGEVFFFFHFSFIPKAI